MVGLNQIAIRIRDNTCQAIAHIARIRQHDKALPILHQAIKLRGCSIVTNAKALNINISESHGLAHFKDMLLSIIDLS